MYGTAGGKPAVVARFEDNDVWLTQKQLADLFNTTKQNINQHTKAIYDSGELDRNRTVKKYLTVQIEGARSIGRHVDHYNLDMIIALGYRIDSPIAIRFRQWATVRLHELIQKGTVSHDEAMEKAEREFTVYRQREMRQLKSDFDKAVRGYLGGPASAK